MQMAMNDIGMSLLVLLFSSMLSAHSTIASHRSQTDHFHEEVIFKSVADAKVYSYFQFTTLWNNSFETDRFDHCRLFPRSLAEIIHTFDVQELHISLTEGHWRHRYWGYPIIEASPGAEIWVWFGKNNKGKDDIDKRWKGLTSTLSGLLCTSFNFINSANSVRPKFSFRPLGVDSTAEEGSEGNDDNERVRYAVLPREIVCTENLTPWKKMLPCDSTKGLASLLNARFIHNTNYHSIGAHYRQMCLDAECTDTKIEFKQTVSLVYDLVLLGGRADEWSIRKLFGTGLFSYCPLATTSNIYVDVSDNNIELNKQPDSTHTAQIGGNHIKYAIYDVHRHASSTAGFNLVAKIRSTSSSMSPMRHSSPLLHVNRYIREYGKENGGIVVKIYNNHRKPLVVTYFENIPWFVPIYYHTLKIRRIDNGEEIKPLAKRYAPGSTRTRPYYLEVVLRVPGRSVVELSVDFDYTFLKWQEYPPDANHGFYVGSAVVSAALPYARNYRSLPASVSLLQDIFNATWPSNSFVVQMRTESFILGLPTPDFSMPYNVICLACTVVALAFGPLHNITTKRLRLASHSAKGKWKAFVVSRIAKIFGRSAPNDAASCSDSVPDSSVNTEATKL